MVTIVIFVSEIKQGISHQEMSKSHLVMFYIILALTRENLFWGVQEQQGADQPAHP